MAKPKAKRPGGNRTKIYDRIVKDQFGSRNPQFIDAANAICDALNLLFADLTERKLAPPIEIRASRVKETATEVRILVSR